MSTVFRVEKTANFTVMANIHLKDRRISLKSKGLLSVILSLPPDWDYTITGLAHIAADGVDSVKTAVRELERYGYVTRRQLRDERGRMARNEYIVYENPAENPDYIPPDRTTPDRTTPEQTTPENNAAAKKAKKSAPKKKRVFSVSPSAENPSAVSPTADNTQADT
ncbi:MAG: helix-turn-helix domain-containing protein, partial [Oscillospiraceae bacterium]|nr:helix-turn-helix domain-containing protein [Oscillospiraceae bacterium]